MKRVICFICFFVVIFHAWNPGSLVSTQETPKEFVGIKSEFQTLMETLQTHKFHIGKIPYWEYENGDLEGCESLSNIEYVSIDINQDSQKDLIIKVDTQSNCFRYGSDSVLVVFMNDVSQNFNLKFKGMKFICRRSMVGCPKQSIIKKGRTLVLHDHVYRISLTERDFFHRPKRISIRNLTKDSFYDTLFSDVYE